MKRKLNEEWHQKLTLIIAVFISSFFGGFVVLLIAMHTHLNKSTDAAGLVAAICGILAALLGISIAVIFAIEWAFMNHMIDNIKKELRSENRKYVQGMVEFTLLRLSSWRDIQSYNQAMERQLENFPATWNAAALMSETCIERIKIPTVTETGYIKEIPKANIEWLVSKAEYWADQALKKRETHDPGYPELVKSLSLALQKLSNPSMNYLEMAFYKNKEYRDDILRNQVRWDVLTGMTHGETDLKQLDQLLMMLGLTRPTEEDIKKHCDNLDNSYRAQFDVISKNKGDSNRIVVEGIPDTPNNTVKWKIFNSVENILWGDNCSDSSMAFNYLTKDYIVTRIIENK